ncbi:MAG TPA: hypothetical protein VGJ93_02240 [Desulfuromonadaceae bacterium]|jgi:hypothetical protein
MEPIREPVRVAAVFAPGRQIRPVWFDWQNRKYTIHETTYCWKGRSGEAMLLHFSVSDGSSLFELIYNTIEQSWMLGGVEA